MHADDSCLRFINRCQGVIAELEGVARPTERTRLLRRLLTDELRLHDAKRAAVMSGVFCSLALRAAQSDLISVRAAIQLLRDANLQIAGRREDPAASPERSVEATLTKAALARVNTRYRDPRFSVHGVARELRVSRWHLGRVVVRVTGQTLREHLALARLGAARSLLRGEGRLSVKEVAGLTGFSSASEFVRQFRRHHGVTPRRYMLRADPPAR